MTRPTLEVADILRAQGDRFLDRYRSSFDFQQLKAFRASALPALRTSGHFLQLVQKSPLPQVPDPSAAALAGEAHGCFQATAGIPVIRPSTPRWSGTLARKPPSERASRNVFILTRFVTVLRRIYSRMVLICAPFKSC